VTIETIPVDSQGLLDLDFLRRRLPETALLCTMAVNNITGVIAPISAISTLIREDATAAATSSSFGCLWFVDGVAALGKRQLSLTELGVHYACFSGHKVHSPKGIGFIYIRPNAPFSPTIIGGGQERGKRYKFLPNLRFLCPHLLRP
jgi:cysteine desulfurase